MIRPSDRRPVDEQGWFGPKKTPAGPAGYPKPRKPRRGRGAQPVDAGQQLLARAALLAGQSDTEVGPFGTLDGTSAGRRRGGRRVGGWEITNRRPRPEGGGIVARNRKQLLPHLVAVGALLLALITHAAAAAAGIVGSVAIVTAAGAVGVSTVSVLCLRRAQKVPHGWTAWTIALCVAASTWLTAAVAVGISWALLAVLLGIDYGFAARWWARHRHANPVTKPGRGQPADEPAEEGLIPAAWRSTVGAKDGVLPGSRLVDAEPAEHGTVYTLQLTPGKQALADVLAALGKIASGLKTPMEQLLAEAHPSRDPSQVRFQVITASPVDKPVLFTQPQFENGCVVLGPYADGVSHAMWRLYTHKSMWGGMVIGGTGSGKSRLLELIALVAMFTEHTYVIHVDGQDGQSCPMLWHHAAERAGSDDADTMLQRLEAMQRRRQRTSGADGKAGFRPSPGYPGILVIVDEAHAVITQQNAERWAKIAREARKVGIAVVMGDQDGTLETFKKDVLRSSLMAGNCVGLRTNSRSQGQILGDGKFNLRDLPKIPGFGYTIATDDAGRTAPYRGQWLPDADDAEELAAQGEALPEGVRLIEEWYPAAPRVDLDTDTAAASPTRRTPKPQAVQLSDDVPFVPAPAAAPQETDSRARVLAAVSGGAQSPTDIVATSGVSKAHVHRLLPELIRSGELRKTDRGQYEPALPAAS